MVGLSREFNSLQDLSPQVITPAELPGIFRDAQAPRADLAAPVETIKDQNASRAAVSEKGMQQVNASLQVLDEQAQPEAADAAPTLPGIGLKFAAGAMAGAAIDPILGTTAALALTVAGGVGLAADVVSSFKASADSGPSSGSGGSKKDNNAESAYRASGPTPGTWDYAAAQGRSFGMASDARAFKNAGFDVGRMETTGANLAGVTRIKLEEKRDMYAKSMENVGLINESLNRRELKGTPQSDNTLAAADKRGLDERSFNQKAVFGV